MNPRTISSAIGALLLAITLLAPQAVVGNTAVAAEVRSDVSDQIDRYVTARLSASGAPAAATWCILPGTATAAGPAST